MLVTLLEAITWPLETNRQTFKTHIQDIQAYSITKIMKNPCKAKTCINKGVKLF